MATFTLLAYLCGLSVCILYAAFPFVYSLIRTPKDSVWVPVNNEQRYVGDVKIYTPMVQEARLNFFKYRHPSSNEIGNMAIDFTRATSYRLAALLGLFLPDPRFAFLFSFVLGILLQYSLCFYIFEYVFANPVFALAGSTLLMFWVNLFITKERKDYALRLMNNTYETTFDNLCDNFRYIIMSIGAIFLWATVIMVMKADVVEEHTLFITYLIFFLVAPLVYPPVSLGILFVSVGAPLIYELMFLNFEKLLIIAMAGGVALLLLLLTGITKRINDIRNSDLQLLEVAHSKQEDYKINLINGIFGSVANKYVLVPAISAVACFYFKRPDLFSVFVAIASLFFVLKSWAYFFRKNVVVKRFIHRGLFNWAFFSLVVAAFFVCSLVDNYFNVALSKYIVGILLVPIIGIPVIGSLRMTASLRFKQAFYLPKAEWQAYQFINKMLPPRKNMLALAFSNMTLLPVYTNMNLSIRGVEFLDKPESELAKYAAAFQYLNISPAVLENWFRNYHGGDRSEEENVQGYYLLHALIYESFTLTFDGTTMRNHEGNDWSDEFISKYRSVIYRNDHPAAFITGETDYIITSRFFELKREIPYDPPPLFEKIFDNGTYFIYQRFKMSRKNIASDLRSAVTVSQNSAVPD